MLSGAGTGFFQSTIGTNELQKTVVIDHGLAAARAKHAGLQADAGLDRAGGGVIGLRSVLAGGG